MGAGSFHGRLLPLALAQGLGVFNDNAFRAVTAFTALLTFKDYSDNAFFLCLMTAVYVLPFVLFPQLAGHLADRFPKRDVMVVAKLAEIAVMLLGTLTLLRFGSWGIYPVVATLFVMSTQSAFFSPAYNASLPEAFSESEISRANGVLGMVSFIAVLVGFAAGAVLTGLVGGRLYLCGLVFTAISGVGCLGSLFIRRFPAADPRRRLRLNLLKQFASDMRAAMAKRGVFVTLCGEAYFYSMGASFQIMALLYAKFTLRLDKVLEQGALQISMAVGMALGCLLAGKASRGKVELGLVPFGAAGMVVCTVLLLAFPGGVCELGGFHFFPLALCWLGLLGVAAGYFAIPQRAYQQQRADKAKRGAILASGNFLTFGGILLFTVATYLLADAPKSSGLPNLPPEGVLLALAAATAAFTVALLLVFPEVARRAVAVALTRTLYKLRVFGLENVPEEGPVVLVSNHVSFLDGLLITAASSRFIRVVSHEDYFRLPLLGHLFRFCGSISLPAEEKTLERKRAFEAVKRRLAEGEAVCVFPEGKVTLNGVMSEFKEGLGHILPHGRDIPVIPVRLGMLWGGFFTYYEGRFALRVPPELPCPTSVSFGKPLSHKVGAFALRQAISELAADTDLIPRDDERTLHYQFIKNAKRHPFRKLVGEFEGEWLRAFPLLVRALVLSGEVRKLKPRGDYVGVLLPNCAAASTAIMAVLMADKSPAMLNFTTSQKTMNHCARKAGLDVILTSRLFLAKLNYTPSASMVYLEDLAKGIPFWSKLWRAALAVVLPHQELAKLFSPKSHRGLDHVAALLFSSGSTSEPKGVMLTHHNFNSDVNSFIKVMACTGKDRIVGNLPLFHVYGFNVCFWIPMMFGLPVLYLRNPLDAAATGNAILQEKLTLLVATPTFLMTYLRKCPPEQFQSLRLVIVGAERARQDLIDKFRELTGKTPIEGYGCTELSPVVSINLANSVLDLGIKPGRHGSVGHPMPGVCVKIVDPETRKAVPPDHEGLLLVKGPIVMKGYLGEPERTAAAIKDGWYDTGDIGKMDAAGFLSITGRLARFSKIGGEMVPHELVEVAIHELLAAEERKVVVAGVPDKAKGERLLILHAGLPLSPERIVEALRAKGLPNLWIPKAADFVKIDAFPILGNGKLDIRSLAVLAAGLAAERA